MSEDVLTVNTVLSFKLADPLLMFESSSCGRLKGVQLAATSFRAYLGCVLMRSMKSTKTPPEDYFLTRRCPVPMKREAGRYSGISVISEHNL